MGVRKVGIIGFLGLAVVFAGASVGYQHGTRENITFTVTEKERIGNRNNQGSKYLIWGTRQNGEKETLENTDAWLSGKFNSSDIYGDVKVGCTYKATVYGWRIAFLSAYRNIVSIKVAPGTKCDPAVKAKTTQKPEVATPK